MTPSPRVRARPASLALIAALAIALLPGGTARPAAAASSDLFISEYIEGSSNNKALEIFNDTGAALDLATGGYNVQMFFNGSATSTLTINLTGTVAQGDVFVLAQSSAAAAILAQADQTNGAGWFNGDDAVVLRKGTTVLDVIGQIGVDPGTEWGSGLASTADNTLRRKTSVVAGDPNGGDAFDPSLEWDGYAMDTIDGLGAHGTPPGDTAPTVTASTPADGAADVAVGTTLSLTFSESVTLDAGTIQLVCDADPIDLSISAGPATTFTADPVGDLPAGAACLLSVAGGGVHDVDTQDPPDGLAGDAVIDFTTAGTLDPCASPFTAIPSIQGSGASAAITGSVTIQGVVVGDYEGPGPANLRGFYVQGEADGDPATSDGIFVFNNIGGTSPNLVSLGDVVRVTGNAGENQDQTQVSAQSIVACGTTDTVTPTEIDFPVASPTFLERYEGMLVTVPETMTVTEHFQLGRFGQVVVSSGGRLDNPTAVVDPGAPALALQAANNLRKIIVDDALQTQNPDPIVFGRGGQPLSASNTLRGGDTITGLTGVLTYTWAGNAASGNAYRIRPLNALSGAATFSAVNQRPGPSAPLEGSTRVAAMNLLNYFNTFSGCTRGVGGPSTECRGASNQPEFDRQVAKTVAAIVGMDVDVLGVNEIENDGYAPTSAIAHLVGALNAQAGAGTYAYIDVDGAVGQPNALGDDAIKVGLIYRPGAVTPVGDTAVLNDPAFTLGGDDPAQIPADQAKLRSRPSLAQAFETPDGARFIVDVNHFKSKGSACQAPAENDGQGNCNIVRTNGASELVEWLSGDPTGTGDEDVLIMGDLNSYAKEDPIRMIEEAGYLNLVADRVDDPYSYVFDGQWGYLDHALGSPSVTGQVVDVLEWHINSDEPSVLDYLTDFKSAGQQVSLYAPDRFRVSDHDPILVGLDADSDRPTVDAGGPYEVIEGDSIALRATGSDPTDDELTYAWDLDGDGSFETPGAEVTFDATALQAPGTVTVTVQVTDEHGQASTDSVDIRVIWAFDGFGPPSAPNGVTEIKAGSAHPVKFSLDGPQGMAVLDGNPTFQRHACPTGAAIGQPISTTASEPFAYDPATDTYRFTWKTQKAWAGWCGTLTVALADGERYDLEVRFKP